MVPIWYVGPLVITEEGDGYRISRAKFSTRIAPALARLLVLFANHADQGLSLEEIVHSLAPLQRLSESSVRPLVSQLRPVMARVLWKVEFGRRLQWNVKGKTYTWQSRPSDIASRTQSLPEQSWAQEGAVQRGQWRSALDGRPLLGAVSQDSTQGEALKETKIRLRVGDRVATLKTVPNFNQTNESMLPKGSVGVIKGLTPPIRSVHWAAVTFLDIELQVIKDVGCVVETLPSIVFNMPISWFEKL